MKHLNIPFSRRQTIPGHASTIKITLGYCTAGQQTCYIEIQSC